MGMSRAQAQAYLASQGIYPPNSSYSGTSAVDVLQAARPNPNLGYMQIGAQALPRLFPGEKTPQEELQAAMAESMRAQAAALRGQTSTMAKPAAAGAALGSAGLGSAGLGSGLDFSGLGMGGGSFLSTPTSAGAGASAASSAVAPAAEVAETSTLGLGGAASVLAPAAALAAAGYTGYKAYDAFNNAKKNHAGFGGGLKQGIKDAGVLNAVPLLGQAVWLGGALGGAFGGGKHKDQYQRDAIRRDMKQRGLIDDAYNITLANGAKYDIGKDGSIKNYNVDFSKQGIGDTVSALNPLSMLVTGGDTNKRRSDLTGYYTNAASSSGDVNANIRKMYSDAGFNHDSAYGAIHQMQQAGTISKEEGDQAKNALDKAYGVGAYAQQRPTNPQLVKRNVPQINNADKSRWK